jgi:predicted RNase H-like HicB family nuclease
MDIISFPVLISKEGEWFVASCPLLDIGTQGRTEEEVKENIADLIEEYMEDPDTPKPAAPRRQNEAGAQIQA